MHNFFRHQTAAQRYADARPYFHPLIVDRLRAFSELVVPVGRALDVACGTGQSTRALTAIAGSVVGIDASPAMIQRAPALPDVAYSLARAEALPFGDTAFELVTVGLAVHWFDQTSFLGEVARVLRPGGWLVIYENGFRGQMREKPAFRTWIETYGERYPSPPRGSKEVPREHAETVGLTSRGRESYANDVPMLHAELVNYLLTQSNVIAAVEEGQQSVEEVAAWIEESVSPFFDAGPRTMMFGGTIEYWQKDGS
jgi:SAM-dependent methyltransferase